VVALQRGTAASLGGGVGAYLEVLGEEALLSVALRSGAAVVSPGVLPLGPLVQGELLRVLGIAAGSEAPRAPESIDSLEAAMASGRLAAKEARRQRGLGGEAPGPGSQPGVRRETLQDLEAQAQAYKENNHVIYREDFFDDATWAAILRETKRLWKSPELEANCNLDGVNRLGGYVLDHMGVESSLYHLLYGNEPFRRWVSAVNGEGEMYPSDFPIELREYGPKSKGMVCHPDLQMYATPRKDSEFAVTVDNQSPCNVSFWDASGEKHIIQTKGNSVMMVRANAAVHCVGPTNGGTRSILKFIYVGDYRKSPQFWSYTGNECDDSNPNRQVLAARRKPHGLEL